MTFKRPVSYNGTSVIDAEKTVIAHTYEEYVAARIADALNHSPLSHVAATERTPMRQRLMDAVSNGAPNFGLLADAEAEIGRLERELAEAQEKLFVSEGMVRYHKGMAAPSSIAATPELLSHECGAHMACKVCGSLPIVAPSAIAAPRKNHSPACYTGMGSTRRLKNPCPCGLLSGFAWSCARGAAGEGRCSKHCGDNDRCVTSDGGANNA